MLNRPLILLNDTLNVEQETKGRGESTGDAGASNHFFPFSSY